MELMDYTNINRGTRGIFEGIEKQANHFCSLSLIIMSVISFFLIVITSIESQGDYMTEIIIADSINIILGLTTGIYCQIKKDGTRYRKYVLFFVWFIVLTIILTYVDPNATLLYAIPIVLAIWYHSMIFTLFVSVINIVFAFFPYIINTYFGYYSPSFIVLNPNTTIEAMGTSLEEAVYSISDIINRSETIINMLLYGYLTTVMALVILAVIAVAVTAYNRKQILSIYNKKRDLLEDQYK